MSLTPGLTLKRKYEEGDVKKKEKKDKKDHKQDKIESAMLDDRDILNNNDNDTETNDTETKIKKSKKSKLYKSFKISSKQRELEVLDEENDEIDDLTGIVVGVNLYLINKKKNMVYDSLRDENGELVKVGLWNEETKTIDFNVLLEEKIEDKTKEETVKVADEPEEEENENDFKVSFPYEVDDADHCETDMKAYEHIEPLLTQLCKLLDKSKENLRIYDPYYCNGAIIKNMAKLGFTNVYNKKEDFYKKIATNSTPDYDVLITNPPYSQDHMEKILKFCVNSGKIWFLLIPNYVYCKPYYSIARQHIPIPCYLTPPYRYEYHSPSFLRSNLNSGQLKTSPFLSFWYIQLGKYKDSICKYYKKTYSQVSGCSLSYDTDMIPRKFKDSFDPNRKKLRKNQRDARKKKTSTNNNRD